MKTVFSFHQGSTPLLISVPHDGRVIPEDIQARMTPAGLDKPDTDWHVAKLYDFANGLGASVLVAQYSRYVVDLNRPANDDVLYPGQVATGLCPAQSFAGDEIYLNGESVSAQEQGERIVKYWQPYHDEIAAQLARLQSEFGYALLWDAHSIPGVVPRLFDGELPDLNIGTFDEKSCTAHIANPALRIAENSPYSVAMNGRFKGGYITRHYGEPERNSHAIQLEIAQRCYMDEDTRLYSPDKAEALGATLTSMLQAYLDAAERHYQ